MGMDIKKKVLILKHRNVINDRDIAICNLRKQGYSLAQIGKQYKITRERVRQIVSRYHIKNPVLLKYLVIKLCKCGCGNLVERGHRKYLSGHYHKSSKVDISIDTLDKLYNEDKKSVVDIGKLYGVHYHTIRRYMDNYEIKRRGAGSIKGKSKPHTLKLVNMGITIEQINKLYWIDKLSLKEIANKLGVHYNTVRNFMITYNVNRRHGCIKKGGINNATMFSM